MESVAGNAAVIQFATTGVSFAVIRNTNLPYMRALLIPHLVNGWPYLLIGVVCIVVVHHFRERLDK
ncbi:MAG TPA: hypothetical protein VM101_11175 [Flavitalea sp.]|nr:hypothetical protein [Flavitalea sp.]